MTTEIIGITATDDREAIQKALDSDAAHNDINCAMVVSGPHNINNYDESLYAVQLCE